MKNENETKNLKLRYIITLDFLLIIIMQLRFICSQLVVFPVQF